MSDSGGMGMGGAFGAMGSLMEGDSKSKAYDRQAEELDQNAEVNRAVGQFNVMRQQIIANRKIGAATADFAASGVRSDSGSVMAVIGASHANAELDRLSIIHGAEVKSSLMERRAEQDRESSAQATQMGYFNAVASLFGAATKAGNAAGNGPEPGSGYNGMDTGGGGGNSGYGSAGGTRNEDEYYA